jgi:hypothetical protein
MAKAEQKPQELTDCPEWGKGGSYTIDPKTGVRTLVERHGQAAQPEAAAAPATDSASNPA